MFLPVSESPVLRAGVRFSAYASQPIELPSPGGWHSCALAASLPLLGGCLHMNIKPVPVKTMHIKPADIKRFTYETLRQADCRMNDIDDFCDRGYLAEYREYETLRRNFLREQ